MGNSLVFNGINSSRYGVIISGGGTYATPERDVSVVTVPGRNGDLIIDNGRFNNIQITYTAGISKGFETKFLPFIRALKAVKGYARLVDSYHPDYYRLASFRSELVPDVGTIMRSGHFDLVFDCKPQRFLKSGEVEVPFPDSAKTRQPIYTYNQLSSNTRENIVDAIGQVTGKDMTKILYYVLDMSGQSLTGNEITTVEGGFDLFFAAACSDDPTTAAGNSSTTKYQPSFLWPGNTYNYWLVPAAANIKVYADGQLIYENPNTEHKNLTNQSLYGAKPLVKVDIPDGSGVTDYLFSIGPNGVRFTRPNVFPYNRAQTITIDCELMDAYSLPRGNAAGSLVNWNPYVTFVKAPELEPGDNDIAYDSTVTNLRITPRWWSL